MGTGVPVNLPVRLPQWTDMHVTKAKCEANCTTITLYYQRQVALLLRFVPPHPTTQAKPLFLMHQLELCVGVPHSSSSRL